MSDNPLDPSPAFLKHVETLMDQLWRADGSPVDAREQYRERADELARMEAAGPTGLEPNPMTQPGGGVVVEEAFIQENLGEFPSGKLGDEGRFRQTPMTREELRHPDEDHTPEGGVSA